jgi:hypothetical protein
MTFSNDQVSLNEALTFEPKPFLEVHEKVESRVDKLVSEVYSKTETDIPDGEKTIYNKSNFISPIIICGCHGGGTSFTTKILRHLGLFSGSDSGRIELRKFHESDVFFGVNEKILQEILPNSPFGMVTVNKSIWKKFWKNLNNKTLFQKVLKGINVEKTLATYSATGPLIKAGSLPEKRPVLYGWKDPRNSLTLKIWKEIFPFAKVLIIQANHKPGLSVSPSGDWFRNTSDEATRKIFMNPPGLDEEKDDYLKFNYKTGMKSLEEFNVLVKWLGKKELTLIEFQELLKLAQYEGS